MAPRKKITKPSRKSKQVENAYEPIASSVPEQSTGSRRKVIIPVIIILAALGLFYLFRGTFIAATVNGQPIGRMTVIKELEKQSGKQALESVITKTLVMQDAKKKGVNISDADLDAQIKKIEQNVKAQGMSLDQLLQAQGMKKADLRDQVRLQLAAEKLAGKVSVSDKEVADYIEQNKEQLEPTPGAEVDKTKIKDQLMQQKQQQKTQEYVTTLRKNAKISYLTNY